MPKKVHKGTFFVLGHKEPALRKGKPLALSLCSRIKKRKRRAYDPGSKHCTFFMLAHKEPALRKGMCPFELKTNPMQNSGGLGEGRTKGGGAPLGSTWENPGSRILFFISNSFVC